MSGTTFCWCRPLVRVQGADIGAIDYPNNARESPFFLKRWLYILHLISCRFLHLKWYISHVILTLILNKNNETGSLICLPWLNSWPFDVLPTKGNSCLHDSAENPCRQYWMWGRNDLPQPEPVLDRLSSTETLGFAFVEQWLVARRIFRRYLSGLHYLSREKFASFSRHAEMMLEFVG